MLSDRRHELEVRRGFRGGQGRGEDGRSERLGSWGRRHPRRRRRRLRRLRRGPSALRGLLRFALGFLRLAFGDFRFALVDLRLRRGELRVPLRVFFRDLRGLDRVLLSELGGLLPLFDRAQRGLLVLLRDRRGRRRSGDRKSTRLNSSHRTISYAVFCLKKKRISY